MLAPKKSHNEAERLHALRALRILDTSREERFDRVTRMAKQVFNVPIALVSFVDENRQWFKSSDGLEVAETTREVSFCGHAIHQDDLMIISDTKEDPRFFDNPLVLDYPHVRFYAGFPLKLRPGVNIGTLCLLDTKPRVLAAKDQQLLQDFGAMIEQEIRSMQWATSDELTMLYCRRGFFTLAEHAREMCIKESLSVAFVFMDLDGFKCLNDQYGHQEGDFALMQFAAVMQKTFRDEDIVGRFGGDEFIVMLYDTEPEVIQTLLDQFDDALLAVNQEVKKPYQIEFSAGVAVFPPGTLKSLDEMIVEADTAMYERKCKKSSY